MPVLYLVVVVAAVSLSLAAPVVADEAYYNYILGACQKSSFRCSDSVDVCYPFFLANATSVIEGDTAYAESYCGYPGMPIACEGGRATQKLKGDSYTVLDIDYGNHTLMVAEADALSGGECPWVTRNPVNNPRSRTCSWLNLSDTANDNLVFFFDCVFTAATPRPPSALLPINCSSLPERDRVSYVVDEPDLSAQDEWPLACKEPVVVPVLKDRLLSPDEDYLSRLNSDGYGQLLKQGFQLTWDPTAGPCFLCEQSKGQRGYNQSGEFVGCLCSDGSVHSPDCGLQDLQAQSGKSQHI
ncbi:LEAF RUST 10 DISEASE-RESISTANCEUS RECEPTOR-LIKE PROTEIN KINASE-like 1.2 [Miscanthus floridulus]|uniref:LEAF RUST 10 DISEASE-RESISTANCEUS RECEPTOR-LIKE PROTEIN KINASE-like 1.2 n=1 Tax=Miscanthus floridulus TaxID=154761 RepID=UPI00345A248E